MAPRRSPPPRPPPGCEPADTLGIPLGTGQPPAFMAALGERDDWDDLRIYGALLLAWSRGLQAPERPLPLRVLRPGRARAARPGRQHQLRARRLPPLRAAARAAAPAGDGDGRRAARRGRLVQPLAARRRHARRSSRRAGADPDRLLIVEVSPRFPRTLGLPPEHRHAIHVDQIDVLVETDAEPFALPEPEPGRRSTRRSPTTPGASSPTARRCRPGSARSPRRSSACSPRATAATTGSTRRCSPTG